jgi:Flp pilus assembly protein TadG
MEITAGRIGSRTSRRRFSPEGGVALVEMAIGIIVLLIILFGVAELSFIYRSASAVSSATRAGARLAAATYTDAPDRLVAADQVRQTVDEALRQRGSTDTPTFMRIYEAGSNGQPANGASFSACSASCLRYQWDGSSFVYQAGTWTDPDGCGTTVDRVGVYVEYQHDSISGVVDLSGSHGERTVMRLEPSVACT